MITNAIIIIAFIGAVICFLRADRLVAAIAKWDCVDPVREYHARRRYRRWLHAGLCFAALYVLTWLEAVY